MRPNMSQNVSHVNTYETECVPECLLRKHVWTITRFAFSFDMLSLLQKPQVLHKLLEKNLNKIKNLPDGFVIKMGPEKNRYYGNIEIHQAYVI